MGKMAFDVLLIALLLALLRIDKIGAQLSMDYYSKSCPDAEKIIYDVMVQKQKEAFVTAAGALRIFFHDCFVQGCDASVLVASTPNNKAEKDADDNLSLPGDGFDAFIRAKKALERRCPGVVSCADIISIATRDLVELIGGPFWPVLKGRKDGRVSLASSVPGNLPKPTMSLNQLTQIFQRKGLNQEEMVVLSGSHTVGFAHCSEFSKRIWSYSRRSAIDPTMNRTYAMDLRLACPRVNLDPTVVAFNDVTTPRKFDNVYFENAKRGLGLLASDQILWTDLRTRGTVERLASSEEEFVSKWISAVQKLSLVGVKIGRQGEVRRRCDSINPS